ncbi:MAG: hypothetical protein ACK47B_07335 [Armatimonadota bacterium]
MRRRTPSIWLALYLAVLLPLLGAGGPAAWACGEQSGCSGHAAGCDGPGQACGTECGHGASAKADCCAAGHSESPSVSAGDCVCVVESAPAPDLYRVVVAAEVPIAAPPSVPLLLSAPRAIRVRQRSTAPAAVRGPPLSPLGSRGPPRLG